MGGTLCVMDDYYVCGRGSYWWSFQFSIALRTIRLQILCILPYIRFLPLRSSSNHPFKLLRLTLIPLRIEFEYHVHYLLPSPPSRKMKPSDRYIIPYPARLYLVCRNRLHLHSTSTPRHAASKLYQFDSTRSDLQNVRRRERDQAVQVCDCGV